MFFDRLKELCDGKGISTYKACTDVGLNRAAVAKWKGGSTPNGDTVLKLAEYFGVSVDYLLGKEIAPTGTGKRNIDDFKAAFFEGYGEDLPEEEKEALWEDAREYAKFKMMQKKQRKD